MYFVELEAADLAVRELSAVEPGIVEI